jgi:hypothetical protein
MFGLDTLDLLQEPKPRTHWKLRRGFLYAACPVVAVAAIVAGIAVIQSFPGSFEGVVMFLVAAAINVLISVALGYLAYQAALKRMDW